MENLTTSQITDLRQSAPYAKYIQSMGWKVVTVDNTQVFIRSLGILGAIAKIQRVGLPINFSKMKTALKKQRVWMTKLEPINFHPVPQGFRQDKWPLLASKTLRIDLTPSLATIKNRFKKDARYSIRKSQSANSKSQLNNFDGFYQLWRKANGIKKLWTPSKKQYGSLVDCFANNCFCITIDNLAGALVLIHDRVAYYYYAAALPEAKRKLLPYLVIWECIKEAKKKGCTTWDWEGIFDTRWPNKGWQGFTHFKKSFGGYEVSFPGSFIKWF